MSAPIRKVKFGKWSTYGESRVHTREGEGSISLTTRSFKNVTVKELREALEKFPDDANVWWDSQEEDRLIINVREDRPMTAQEIKEFKELVERKRAASQKAAPVIDAMYARSLAARQAQLDSGVLVEVPEV